MKRSSRLQERLDLAAQECYQGPRFSQSLHSAFCSVSSPKGGYHCSQNIAANSFSGYVLSQPETEREKETEMEIVQTLQVRDLRFT